MGRKVYTVIKNENVKHNSPDYSFYCPGCEMHHAIYCTHPNDIGAKWTFNGNLESPTVNPSILSKINYASGKKLVCHLFVRDGKIQYLNDCTHHLAGKTIEMEDID